MDEQKYVHAQLNTPKPLPNRKDRRARAKDMARQINRARKAIERGGK